MMMELRVERGMAGTYPIMPPGGMCPGYDDVPGGITPLKFASHLAFITPDPAQWQADRSAGLDAGNIEAIITSAKQYPLSGVKAEDLDKKLGYFERNAHRMRYQHFRDLGMFTGSGAIEGGIKAIVVQRAKQSGMHWTTSGAASIIALRCQHASGRWDELWPASTTSPTRPRAAI